MVDLTASGLLCVKCRGGSSEENTGMQHRQFIMCFRVLLRKVHTAAIDDMQLMQVPIH